MAEKIELGFVLAGAVSAGAYTAGVMDFLFEALDAWQKGKDANAADAPVHDVAIKVFSGASAGSVTGAVLASILKYDFAHIRPSNAGADGASNPLYDSWVKRIDILKLLGTTDLTEGQAPKSALDSNVLNDIAKAAVNYQSTVLPRPYLCNPLRFIFTVTNLRGVPFAFTLRSNSPWGQDMTMHADCMRFALTGLGSMPAPPLRTPGNELLLTYPQQGDKWPTWGNPFAQSALASAAFPVGLRPRGLTRATADYDFTSVVLPAGSDKPARRQFIKPAWGTPPPLPPNYSFVNVDGGVMNNEPLELARIALWDDNPLDADDPTQNHPVRKALVMVDPFTGPELPGPDTEDKVNVLTSLFSLFSALKNQARFNPVDVALAADAEVYSRFLIAPVRKPDSDVARGSSYHIASGGLGGFSGFLAQKFREHDFFLGRRNCQLFLAKYFSLPADHPLFGQWTDAQRARYAIQAGPVAELPIIPLVGSLNPFAAGGVQEVQADWPVGACQPDTLKDPISNRLDGLYQGLATGPWSWLLGLGWRFYLRPKIRDFILDKIKADLKERQL